MSNPGQPTIGPGATGDVVRRLQRALRRTPDLGVAIDGIFGRITEARVINFQNHDHVSPDGIVGPITWGALPDGGPMPLLSEGSTGQIVSDLQNLLTNDAPTRWGVTPQRVDGDFGPHTRASVEASQKWGKVGVDGVVGDQTWSVQLFPAIATLETGVGLKYIIG